MTRLHWKSTRHAVVIRPYYEGTGLAIERHRGAFLINGLRMETFFETTSLKQLDFFAQGF